MVPNPAKDLVWLSRSLKVPSYLKNFGLQVLIYLCFLSKLFFYIWNFWHLIEVLNVTVSIGLSASLPVTSFSKNHTLVFSLFFFSNVNRGPEFLGKFLPHQFWCKGTWNSPKMKFLMFFKALSSLLSTFMVY